MYIIMLVGNQKTYHSSMLALTSRRYTVHSRVNCLIPSQHLRRKNRIAE